MDKSHRVNHEEILPDINSTGIESRTALHCAVSDNQPEAVKLLLKYVAMIDAKTIHLRTSLHLACIKGYTTVCKILVNCCSNVNEHDFENNTPIHYAFLYSINKSYNR